MMNNLCFVLPQKHCKTMNNLCFVLPQKHYKTMSELKPEVEYVIKTGRQVVERKQVDFPDKLSKTLDAIKQLYNHLGAQVLIY